MKRVMVWILLAAAPALADEVYLRGGGKMTGEIVEQTDEYVTVDIGGGTLTARMSNVVRIESSTSPLQEYRMRAKEIPADDVEAWRDLARWAQGHMLSSQEREAYRHVLDVLPDDPEANQALGRVQLDGRWVPEAEAYRARGFVRFEGHWMTPQERQSIVTARQKQRQAEEQANQAAIRADEAAIAAEKAQEDAEFERETNKYNHLPEYGDPIPVYWGVGGGYYSAPRRSSAGGGR